ncbi:MAG: two-component system sensor histidine kinase CreC, partial [Deltaproteobacteria bacterium]|nr:two-component system sensor histidine kinase CreC [Deltaproteobacteria bacterium]
EDNGPGIEDFAKQKIFDKFFSMRRQDTGQKSTGLGLNLVKEIAELHNGTIQLENISPHGVRASLSLPI